VPGATRAQVFARCGSCGVSLCATAAPSSSASSTPAAAAGTPTPGALAASGDRGAGTARAAGATPYASAAARATRQRRQPTRAKLRTCPNCRKSLPVGARARVCRFARVPDVRRQRCVVCLLSLDATMPTMLRRATHNTQTLVSGAAGGRAWSTSDDAGAALAQDEWFSWCMRCKHGGHAGHLTQVRSGLITCV
jgi:hypothetical protein